MWPRLSTRPQPKSQDTGAPGRPLEDLNLVFITPRRVLMTDIGAAPINLAVKILWNNLSRIDVMVIGRKSPRSFASGVFGMRVVLPIAQLCGDIFEEEQGVHGPTQLVYAEGAHILPSPAVWSGGCRWPSTSRVGRTASGERGSSKEALPKRPVQ
ncbi:hypothetical protein E2C01_032494 [Portunus trituberculatus]|uniref:Uncharacterized protein n=1 Tax=Portunus trituberculatus TaxID=210409 RepID=A0A5B7F0V2_PORTR|nr:hypothetical protein [Portunus trituberculatus]